MLVRSGGSSKARPRLSAMHHLSSNMAALVGWMGSGPHRREMGFWPLYASACATGEEYEPWASPPSQPPEE